jgi:hypothetical protein
MNGPDSGVGFAEASRREVGEVGEASEPVEGVRGRLVRVGSDLVLLPSGTGRVIGAARYTHFDAIFLLLHLSQTGSVWSQAIFAFLQHSQACSFPFRRRGRRPVPSPSWDDILPGMLYYTEGEGARKTKNQTQRYK